MSEQSSSSNGDTDTGTGTGTGIRWAPHGRALTACLVAVNVALVALVYLYFWRVFSRKRAAPASSPSARDDDGGASSSSSSSEPSPPSAREQQEHDRLVSSLPTFVVRAAAGAGAECAVCIAELRDGDEARAVPRCGHRFHAACVDAWLRRHTTCPLCRASIAAAEVTGAGPKGGGVTDTTAAAAGDVDDAPV